MSRWWVLALLLSVGCDTTVERATGAVVGVGSGLVMGGGNGGGAGGAGGVGGAGGAGGGAMCSSDMDCTFGQEWCVGGNCVACDNSGTVCDIACSFGWATYERNGCFPCECAPPNACESDAQCGGAMACYPGQFCTDWCPVGEPACCFGNACGLPGCGPHPAGCTITGCPDGQECVDQGCVSAFCDCDGIDWICGSDCNGGICQ